MMKVVSFLIKILKYKVLSFLVSNFDIFADSLHGDLSFGRGKAEHIGQYGPHGAIHRTHDRYCGQGDRSKQ